MYQFAGRAQIFNGRFWRKVDVRVKASTLQAAVAAGTRKAIAEAKQKYKIPRIESVTITLQRLGKVEKIEEGGVRPGSNPIPGLL